MIKRMLMLSLMLVFPGITGFPASIYTSCFDCETVTDVYKFKMRLKVPRIYNNTESKGYRKFQTQTIQGDMYITYKMYQDPEDIEQPTIAISNLVNKTHKINGVNITYSVMVNNGGCIGEGPYTRVNAIGDNAKDTFKQISIIFYMDAEPSYNIGEDTEDNSLLVTVSGHGTVKKLNWYPYYSINRYNLPITVAGSMTGSVSGSLGCGCRAYGHKSPTRVMGLLGPTERVDDVATVDGTWRAIYKGRK